MVRLKERRMVCCLASRKVQHLANVKETLTMMDLQMVWWKERQMVSCSVHQKEHVMVHEMELTLVMMLVVDLELKMAQTMVQSWETMLGLGMD